MLNVSNKISRRLGGITYTADRAVHRKERAFTYVALATVVAAAVLLVINLPSLRLSDINGLVRCMSGARVAGVFIHNSTEVDGSFAEAQLAAADPSRANFRASIRAQRYSVDVGCGYDAKNNWLVSSQSAWFASTVHPSLACYDNKGDVRYRRCLPADTA